METGGCKNKHWSESTRQKMIEINRGENHPFYGKHLSEEHRDKIRQATIRRFEQYGHPCVGKKLSEEHKQAILKAIKGRKVSEETKQKIREKNQGKSYPQYWVPILMYDTNGNFVQEFKSITEASKITGYNKNNISSNLVKGKGTYKGYQWRYKESDDYPKKIDPFIPMDRHKKIL